MIIVPNGDPLLWFARRWARLILATSGVRVVAHGVSRIPEGRPCVYMSNHQSHFDVLALIVTLPGQYRILAKRELFYIPVFGWAIWLAGLIPVDRENRDRAIQSIERAAGKVRAGHSILIFAEGTRSPDGALHRLKKGGFHLAMRSGAPIVPIAIRGSRDILPKGALRPNRGVIEVEISDPVSTEAHEGDMEGLMRSVRQALEAGLAGRAAGAT
jgi:1-acyl-sn-glycerol-3-phosphate acyltransferase